MPIYEYRCRECDHRFEQLTSMTANETEMECPACHEKDVEKVLSLFASRPAVSAKPSASTGCTTCSVPSFRSG